MGANIPEQSLIPAWPQDCSCQWMSGRILRRESVIDVPVQREIPSAMTLSIPATCLAWKHHPDDTFRPPSMRINAADLGSLPPLQREIQWMADMLSPFINKLSPLNRGRALSSVTNAHAVTTMPSSSSTLIEISSLFYTAQPRLYAFVKLDTPPLPCLDAVSPHRGA